MLGIRLDSIYSLIWAGRLEAKKVGGCWLIPASAVEERMTTPEAKHE
jgi:excisionase family DNA binding protein